MAGDTHISNGPGALTGIRVLDLATMVMGPYAAQILGDLGADVIKVESPAGDTSRSRGPRRSAGLGWLTLQLNRNKRSVVLNLKDPGTRLPLLELVKTADVLITNLRPKDVDKLGLSYPELAAANPRLVYCNAQGFRSDSSQRDRAAYDEIIQAASGLTDLMRRMTGTPSYVPTWLADKVCGLTIAYAVLAALVHRERTGEGQRVEVPMADTMFAFTMLEHLYGATLEPTLGPVGYPRSLVASHQVTQTKDGWACVLPYSPANWRDVCQFAGRPDLADDPRFATMDGLMGKHFQAAFELLKELTPTHTTDEWAEFCERANIPMGRALDIDQAAESAYYAEGGMLSVVEHPLDGPYRSLGSPVRYSATPTSVRRHAPALGEHTAEILAELGYPPERIAELLSR